MTTQGSSGPLHNLYDYLIGKERQTGEMQNTHLAESWNVSPDARTWKFYLKDGIPYYENGMASEYYTFSPEDVLHTWLLHAGVGTERAISIDRWRTLVNSVDDIVIEGNTLIWNLDVVHPEFGEYLSEDWTFGIISKAYWEEFGGERGYVDHPIGMGAWSFVNYIDNEHFLMEKNYRHYRKEPEFEELQFLWIEEMATRLATLLVEETHIAQLQSDIFPSLSLVDSM